MNQRLYQECLGRLSPEAPFEICRICIQEKNKLISATDTEWPEIRSLYEYITKLKIIGATDYPYFVCLECSNMLHEIEEYLDMLQLSDLFWKRYIKNELVNNKQMKYAPIIRIEDGKTTEESCFESHPEVARVFLRQNSDKMKLENDATELETVVTDNVLVKKSSKLNFIYKNEIDRPYLKGVSRTKVEIRCDICDKEFPSKCYYERHIAVHQRNFNCVHCGMSFKTKVPLLVHLREIHSEGIVTDPLRSICTKCNLELASKHGLRTHVRQCHAAKNETKCKVCHKTMANPKKLNWHMQQHREKRFHCTECPKSFRSQCILDVHAAKHSNFRPYICEQCGMGTKSQASLQRHIEGIHEMKKQKCYKYERSIKCTLCDEIFSKLTVAKRHFSTKHSEGGQTAWTQFRSLCCSCCFLRFDSTVELEEHYSQYGPNHDKPLKYQQIKRGTKPVKQYVSWSQIERPYVCDICKNTFNTPESLSGHMKTHSKKPRPFKCQICGASHPRSNDLRLHILRAHTEDRPFNCSECDYRCLTQAELNSHNRWKHKDKYLK